MFFLHSCAYRFDEWTTYLPASQHLRLLTSSLLDRRSLSSLQMSTVVQLILDVMYREVGYIYDKFFLCEWSNFMTHCIYLVLGYICINMNPSSKTAQTIGNFTVRSKREKKTRKKVITSAPSRRSRRNLLSQWQRITLSLERADVPNQLLSFFLRLLRTVNVKFEQFSMMDSYLYPKRYTNNVPYITFEHTRETKSQK